MLRSHRLLITLTTALALGSSAAVAQAAPGDLDTTYGGGTGASRPDFDGAQQGRAVAIQPDGKIIVGGVATAGPSANVFTARFTNPAGILDTLYGQSGSRSEGFGLATAASGMALASGGKVIVGGTASQNVDGDLFVARLSNGFADLTFGGGSGGGLQDFGGDEEGDALAVAPDGKIVVAGTLLAKDDSVVVARFTADGDNDDAFGNGTGGANPDVGGSADTHAAAVQSDGKILVAGDAAAGGTDQGFVARLTTAGALDPGFSGGHVTVGFGGKGDSVNGMLVQPDGKILVVGQTDAGGDDDFAIARLDTSGKLDPTFGTGGRTTVDFGGGADVATAVALQPNGKIVVVGQSTKPGATFSDIAAARLQPNGAEDEAFGDGGETLVDLGRLEQAAAVALQGDGKIVIAGTSATTTDSGVLVVRLLGDPVTGGGTGPVNPGSTKVPRCGGRKATIIGTSGRDKLKGTKKADVIVGLGGRDTIKGGGGRDRICGGGGNDRLSGQAGNDRLSGGSGNDTVSAGSGNDRASGDAGKDKLLGGAGKDLLSGGGGNDKLLGQGGRDKLKGGAGRDRLAGGAGRDKLSGGPGKDRQKQ